MYVVGHCATAVVSCLLLGCGLKLNAGATGIWLEASCRCHAAMLSNPWFGCSDVNPQ